MATILCCDAHRATLCHIHAALRPLGHELLPAADGWAGLQLARERAPDLVVTAARLPIVDGVTMAATLQKLYGPRRVIFLAEPSDRLSGGLIRLNRPVDTTQLKDLVRTLLSDAAARPEAA
jgi:CheY-like chemotaxis protein